jgi:putative spermidine/putrescine transport system ATP-binding protein
MAVATAPERPGLAQQASSQRALDSDILRLEGVTKRFGDKVALDTISLAVAENEYVSVLGPSGSGKTVLLRVIAGFEVPERGRILCAGRRMDQVAAHRRGIGFVFQNFALFPHLSVYDNVAFGLANRSVAPVLDARERRAKVEAMIDLVGLRGLDARDVHQISGGQRQRVALARTLVTEPRLVLLDEPLGALDANLRARMRSELRAIRARLGVTFLHVTGSETEALAIGDRMVVLDHGRVGQFDTPDLVYNRPASPAVARFLNCYNLFAGAVGDGAFVAGAARFRLPSRRTPADVPAYAIRHDLIGIAPIEAPLGTGEAGVEARYVTSEYSGSTVMHFLELADRSVVEVEHHLGHGKPETFEPRRSYRLAWNVEDAICFG